MMPEPSAKHKKIKDVRIGALLFGGLRTGPWGRLSLVLWISGCGAIVWTAVRMLSVPPVTELRFDPDNAVLSHPVAAEPVDFQPYAAVFSRRDLFAGTPDEQQAGFSESTITADGGRQGGASLKFRLVGIIIDAQARAVVEEIGSPGVRVLAVGDRIDDTVLERIEPQAIWLRCGDELVELQLPAPR